MITMGGWGAHHVVRQAILWRASGWHPMRLKTLRLNGVVCMRRVRARRVVRCAWGYVLWMMTPDVFAIWEDFVRFRNDAWRAVAFGLGFRARWSMGRGNGWGDGWMG